MQLRTMIPKIMSFVKYKMYFCGKHLSFARIVSHRKTARANLPELQKHFF